MNDRANKIRSLCGSEPHDVLVIGGGIVGSGVARDAAMRGLKTALVDRFDFAFGTSSRSSRSCNSSPVNSVVAGITTTPSFIAASIVSQSGTTLPSRSRR